MARRPSVLAPRQDPDQTSPSARDVDDGARGIGLGNLVYLYRMRMRKRLVQEALALLGIAIGVALVFAALVANASLTGSVAQLTSGIVGHARFQLVARGPTGFDARLLGRIQRIPGVKAAAPILEARSVVRGPRGQASVLLVGGDPKFAQLGGTLLSQFTSQQLANQRGVALPAPIAAQLGVRFGALVHVETGAGATDAALGGTLQASDIGTLVHSPVVLAPLAYAQQLSGSIGRVSKIYIETLAGKEAAVGHALKTLAAGQLDVLPATEDVQVFNQAAMPTRQSTAMFSVFAALIGFLFALSAVLLTVPQRRRFIADLRISGHTPYVVAQLMLFDAAVLGVAGAIVGLLIGDQLSRHLFGSIPGYLAYAFPVGSQRIVPWWDVVIASAAGVLAACVAVLAPLGDIFSSRPPQYVRARNERRATTRLVAGGLLALAGSAALLALDPNTAIAALVLLTLSLLLLLPVLVRYGIEGVARLGQLVKSAVPALAVMELRSRAVRIRTVALAATGAIAVFASVAIGGAHSDLLRGLATSARDVDGNADVWVTFPGTSGTFAVTPFAPPPGAVTALERLPGIRGVGVYRGSFLDVGSHRAWVQAPPQSAPWPVPRTQLRKGDLTMATARLRAGGWVVLSEAIANALHVTVGQRVGLPTPVPTAFRVAGISTNIGWPPGAIVLNARDYAKAWGETTPSALQIHIAPGVSPLTVKREVMRFLAPIMPANVQTKAERERQHEVSASEGLVRLTQISILVLGAAILAMATAMGGMIWQRRSVLAGLKVDGFTQRELWCGLLLETTVLVGIGCVSGAVFGLGGQLLLSQALAAVTGFPVVYSTGALAAIGILVIVVTAAAVMLAIPGWLAVRVRPTPGVSA